MAVNLLLGAPGGGKSYEAVAFHVLPALAAGRKVITNLPLVIAEFAAIDPAYVELIEIRTVTKAVRPEFDPEKAQRLYQKFGIAAKSEYWNNAAFSHVEDYGDSWRHPESGTGPLYVVDECHLALPSRGTPVKVEEWYSLHRHESADVLLISQSHAKINRAVVDLVQICYKVRKNTALGSDGSYRRFVLDGVRGAEVNFSVRKYKPQYFKLYKSHTRGGGQEQSASDVVAIWKRPIFIVIAISLVVTIWLVARAGNPIKPVVASPAVRAPSAAPSVPGQAPDPLVTKLTQQEPARPQKKLDTAHALETWQIHQVGEIHYGGRSKIIYRLSRSGNEFFDTDSHKLIEMGYAVQSLSKCFSHVSHPNGYRVHVSCDGPTQAIALPGHGPQPGGQAAGGAPDTGRAPGAVQAADTWSGPTVREALMTPGKTEADMTDLEKARRYYQTHPAG